MINNPIQNPVTEVYQSVNSMCNYLEATGKCSSPCQDCPLVKILSFLNQFT